MKTCDIMGVHLAAIRLPELVEKIDLSIQESDKLRVLYANAHILNMAWDNANLRYYLNNAHITYCDGFGALVASWILGEPVPERFTAPDWLMTVGQHWSDKGYSIYWLGAREGIAQIASEKYHSKFPGIKIAGYHHGYFEKQGPASDEVVEKVNAANPDILIVGFGTTAQEKWITENFDRVNASIVMATGAGIDYIAGTLARGPKWMTDNGLEWLARLIIEPRRLWYRYLVGLPQFLSRVVRYRFTHTNPT